jgi:hypothetical protein
MNRRTLLLATACFALAMQLEAQLQINLDSLAAKARESVDITLDSATLQLAGSFLAAGKSGDAEARKRLSGLKALTVKTFEFAEEGQYRQEDLQPIRAQLRAPGWSKLIDVKEPRESTEIYARTEQGKVAGFAILATEPRELTVVYVEGPIDLADLAGLGGNLGIPNLPPIDQKNKEKGKKGK